MLLYQKPLLRMSDVQLLFKQKMIQKKLLPAFKLQALLQEGYFVIKTRGIILHEVKGMDLLNLVQELIFIYP